MVPGSHCRSLAEARRQQGTSATPVRWRDRCWLRPSSRACEQLTAAVAGCERHSSLLMLTSRLSCRLSLVAGGGGMQQGSPTPVPQPLASVRRYRLSPASPDETLFDSNSRLPTDRRYRRLRSPHLIASKGPDGHLPVSLLIEKRKKVMRADRRRALGKRPTYILIARIKLRRAPALSRRFPHELWSHPVSSSASRPVLFLK